MKWFSQLIACLSGYLIYWKCILNILPLSTARLELSNKRTSQLTIIIRKDKLSLSPLKFKSRNLKFTNNTCFLCDRCNSVNKFTILCTCVCYSVTHMLQISVKLAHYICEIKIFISILKLDIMKRIPRMLRIYFL